MDVKIQALKTEVVQLIQSDELLLQQLNSLQTVISSLTAAFGVTSQERIRTDSCSSASTDSDSYVSADESIVEDTSDDIYFDETVSEKNAEEYCCNLLSPFRVSPEDSVSSPFRRKGEITSSVDLPVSIRYRIKGETTNPVDSPFRSPFRRKGEVTSVTVETWSCADGAQDPYRIITNTRINCVYPGKITCTLMFDLPKEINSIGTMKTIGNNPMMPNGDIALCKSSLAVLSSTRMRSRIFDPHLTKWKPLGLALLQSIDAYISPAAISTTTIKPRPRLRRQNIFAEHTVSDLPVVSQVHLEVIQSESEICSFNVLNAEVSVTGKSQTNSECNSEISDSVVTAEPCNTCASETGFTRVATCLVSTENTEVCKSIDTLTENGCLNTCSQETLDKYPAGSVCNNGNVCDTVKHKNIYSIVRIASGFCSPSEALPDTNAGVVRCIDDASIKERTGKEYTDTVRMIDQVCEREDVPRTTSADRCGYEHYRDDPYTEIHSDTTDEIDFHERTNSEPDKQSRTELTDSDADKTTQSTEYVEADIEDAESTESELDLYSSCYLRMHNGFITCRILSPELQKEVQNKVVTQEDLDFLVIIDGKVTFTPHVKETETNESYFLAWLFHENGRTSPTNTEESSNSTHDYHHDELTGRRESVGDTTGVQVDYQDALADRTVRDCEEPLNSTHGLTERNYDGDCSDNNGSNMHKELSIGRSARFVPDHHEKSYYPTQFLPELIHDQEFLAADDINKQSTRSATDDSVTR